MEEIPIGKVEKFFGKIGVAAMKITAGELKVGIRSILRAIPRISSRHRIHAGGTRGRAKSHPR